MSHIILPRPDPVAPAPTPSAPPPPAPRRIHPQALTRYGLLMGAGMILLALAWSGRPLDAALRVWFPVADWAVNCLIGMGLGTGFALAVWFITERIPAFQRMERRLLRVLEMDALRYHHALVFGLIAGIPEEVLFRGAMQPTMGIVAVSVIFGALHAMTPAYFVYATSAGIALGLLTEVSGGLWMPVAAHFAVDAVMFVLLIRRWRRMQANQPA